MRSCRWLAKRQGYNEFSAGVDMRFWARDVSTAEPYRIVTHPTDYSDRPSQEPETGINHRVRFASFDPVLKR